MLNFASHILHLWRELCTPKLRFGAFPRFGESRYIRHSVCSPLQVKRYSSIVVGTNAFQFLLHGLWNLQIIDELVNGLLRN